MRWVILLILLAGSVGGSLRAQSMIETAAAAAGGSAGGIAGKKVSDGLSKVFEKIDKTAATAAAPKTVDKAKARPAASNDSSPLIEVGPGVPKSDGSNVPPPPAVHRASVRKPAPVPAPAPERAAKPAIEPAPVTPAPPVPEITADDLKHVTAGMQREEVLKLGAPSARITMSEEGHLIEIYRYQAKETTLGVIRLTDGAVSNVAIR
jgi:hypothetical protein